ncbi:MAG: hypothetical protein QOG59_179 [Solirubrobacteraceae bacterium]|jgi:hypothetical protein|nr:hypothetical protein [Solirubrobacteraceae bacterium]
MVALGLVVDGAGAKCVESHLQRLAYPWIRAATCLQVELKPRFFAIFP